MNGTLPHPQYMPGLHVICDFESLEGAKLKDTRGFAALLNSLIAKYKLNSLGDVYHSFPEAGFTAMVCLTESHIAIHTWPEYNRATFDVFLSNYERVNDGHAKEITRHILEYFNATSNTIHEIKR
ncbi:MAG TPA: S-adenosylmethionine decarboxylase [Chitinophagales bacterium]|nr:S-adenosylmethionine decarboxylase [Chitinophagales bacterium]